jgi:SAM-dependent methyltransferase
VTGAAEAPRPEAFRTLDLGCGPAKHPGAFGVDVRPGPGVDLVHDLDRAPWPMPADHYELVHCRDVVEHVADVDVFVRELHRVCAPGARIEIRTPHFSSWYAYNDPTHRHVFGYFFLDHYVNPASTLSARPLFRYVERRFVFSRAHRLSGAGFLANRAPARYEQLFCFLAPCENLHVVLAALK